jgi:hypothetical protein
MKASVVEEGVEELPEGGDNDLKVNIAFEVLMLKDEKRLEGGVTGMTVGGDTEVGKNGFMVMKGSM